MSDSSSDFWGALVDGGFQIGGQALGQYFNKKNMRRAAEIQYEYAQRYAQNAPSWNVAGLRAAGLNPILAVSNGVNLGANIPNISNTSPDGKLNTKFTEALGRMNDRSVNQQNADSNTITAQSHDVNAEANMLRAKADAALKQAQTAEVIQRTGFESERLGQKRYNSPLARDLMGMVEETSKVAIDFFKQAHSYFTTEPTRPDGKPLYPRPTADTSQTRHSDQRKKQVERKLNQTWKTQKKVDGKPVYRRRGDVGGVMHMYR